MAMAIQLTNIRKLNFIADEPVKKHNLHFYLPVPIATLNFIKVMEASF